MWRERERLLNEKQSLGFYLSGHPFNAYRDELRRIAATPLANARAHQLRRDRDARRRDLRRADAQHAARAHGDPHARRRHARSVEVVVFGELFHEKRAVIQEDQVVALRGKVQNDEFSGGLRVTAEKLMDLAEVRAAHAQRAAPVASTARPTRRS